MVGIFGLGYVGLPLMLTFAESNIKVLGFDIDETKITLINNGYSYIKHIETERLARVRENKLIEGTSNFSRVSELDVIILCVLTPLSLHLTPDLSFVIETIKSILPFIRKGQLISLESTTYPGTTEEKLKPKIEKEGFIVGKDIFLAFSPERENPGSKKYNTKNIPKVVGGYSKDCLEIASALYASVIETVVPVSSTKVAELSKLLENIYRAVNIGLVNELKMVVDKMGIDIWEAIDAASTKPFGYTPFYPGLG